MNQEKFSERLRQAMDVAGLKQADLVRLADERGSKLGKSQVSQYVSGKVTPRLATLTLVADLLGVSPAWLDGTSAAGGPSGAPDAATARATVRHAAAYTSNATSDQQISNKGSILMRQFKKLPHARRGREGHAPAAHRVRGLL